MSETLTKETLGFKAEAEQVLNLMIHSVYSNKEIFLRELVSNASDACDMLRFEALTDSTLFEDDQELTIRVGYDAQARTVTVSDNGIGMSRQEVVEHIVYRHGFLGQPGECIHAAGVSANARRTTAGARKPSRSINHCWF